MSKRIIEIKEEIARLVQEAYQLGRIAGIDDIARAAGAAHKPTNGLTLQMAKSPTLKDHDPSLREGSTIKFVYEYVRDNQGLTGVEIVRGLHNQGNNVEERTVRTALHRLKRKLLDNNGGKWFLK